VSSPLTPTDTTIMPDQSVGVNGNNGYRPRPDLRVWGYPYGVQSLPELLAALQEMSDSLDSLMYEAHEVLEKTSTD
jgi:hypothetical protein